MRGDDIAGPGLGTGLGQSLAGMKNAWSKCEAWGSIVTGLIRLGGEIIDGSIWVRWLPFAWCPCPFLLPCPSLILGNEGRGFPRRLYRTDGCEVSSLVIVVMVSNESIEGRGMLALLLRLGVMGRTAEVRADWVWCGGGVHGVRYR